MSRNGGTSWSAVNPGLSNPQVAALAGPISATTTLFAGTNGGGVFAITLTPTLTVSPTAIDFGLVAVQSASGSQTVTLGNTGTLDLVISSISATGPNGGEFVVVPGSCPNLAPTLAPGSSCTVEVTFTPTTVGTKSATLQIEANDPAASLTSIGFTALAYDPPPFGTVTINGGAAVTNQLAVELALLAVDNSGTVAEMRFSNNNNTWSSWELYGTSKSWNLNPLGGDGSRTVYVQFRDGAGNVSGSFFSRITYDTTPPVTTFSLTPAAFSRFSSGSIGFAANETGATFLCSLDGAAESPCTSPFAYDNLADGSHTFSVRATDPAGNLNPTLTSHAWTIDTAAPDTTIDAGPPSLTNAPSGSFTFSSPDSTGTFECSLDGGPYTACASPRAVGPLADGGHTFAVRAKDPAGNVDLSPASLSWTVDTVPPNTTITSGPANPSYSSDSGGFDFTASEGGSGFECSLDGEPFVACPSPWMFVTMPDGLHNFQVRAVDLAGNVDPTPASYGWNVYVNNVRVAGMAGYHSQIGAAYASLADGSSAILETRGIALPGDLAFGRDVTVELVGGYDFGSNTNPGVTTIQGNVTVGGGTVSMIKQVVKGSVTVGGGTLGVNELMIL
jgi:hypothetical protein